MQKKWEQAVLEAKEEEWRETGRLFFFQGFFPS
jgi:hypothetical protein